MPISREEKEEIIAKMTEQFQRSQVIVWADYRGLPMPRLNELRRNLRPHQAEFHIIKNTLAELALQRAGLPVPQEMLRGPTGAGLVFGNIPGAARALVDFVANNRELVIKGGQANQRILPAEEVAKLPDLPSREVLLAQALGGMKAPLAGLVTVLGGTVRSLLYVLQARAKQLEGASA